MENLKFSPLLTSPPRILENFRFYNEYEKVFILFWALQIYLCDYVHVELLLGPCSKNVAAICHRWTRWIKVYNTLKCRQVRSECSKPDFSSFIMGNSYTTSKHNGSNHWNNSPYKSWFLFDCEVLYLIVGRHCLKSFSCSYSLQNLKIFISPWALRSHGLFFAGYWLWYKLVQVVWRPIHTMRL